MSSMARGGGLSLRRLLPVLLLVAALVGFFATGLDDYFTFRALSDHRDRLLGFVADHYLLALLLYAGLYVVAVALSFPGGLLMTVSGGFLFGWMMAGSVTVLAATVGATVPFLIARTALGEPLRARAGPWLARLERGFQANAMNYLLFLRLVPAFPFWLINIAPAFLGVSLRTYFIGTLVGIVPGTFVFAYLGTGLDSIIARQQASHRECVAAFQAGQDGAVNAEALEKACPFDFDFASLVTREMVIAFVALGVVALIPILIKKFRLWRVKV